MRSLPRASLAVWAAAAGLWLLFFAFLGLHLKTPSDGARLAPGEPQPAEAGLRLEPLEAGPLQPGDLLLGVEGQSVASITRDLPDWRQPGPSLSIGQTVVYTVERAGQPLDLPIRLSRYPLGAVLAANWGSIFAAIIWQLTAAFVFLKRPTEPVARSLLLFSAAMLASTTWSLGLQVSDLTGRAGFWLYSLSTIVGYTLMWPAALHTILLFPTPWPPLARRGWIVAALYAVPYLALALAALLAGAEDAWARMQHLGSVTGYVQGTYALLALVAAVRSFRSARDAISRAQVRWVTTACAIVFLFDFSLGVVPQLVVGDPILSWDVLALTGLLVPLAFGVAILRYRLFDIDVILNRTLVYGVLTAAVVSLYVGAVGAFDVVARSDQRLAPLLLVAILALFILRPLHGALQRGANRLVPAAAGAVTSGAPASTAPPVAEPMTAPEPQGRPARLRGSTYRLAWGLFWLALAICLAGFGLCLLALVQSGGRQWLAGHIWFSPVLALGFALVGALVSARHPRNPIGWICGAVGVLSAVNLLAFGYRLAAEAGIRLPGAQVVYWIGLWIWIPATMLPLSFLLLLFPDGRLPSARWRLVGWAAGLGVAGYTLGTALHPSPSIEPNPTPNPFGIPGAAGVLDQVMLWTTVLFAVSAVGSVAALVVRFRRARGVERAQLKWLAYAGVLGLLGNLAIYAWSAGRPNDGAAYDLMLIGTMTMMLALAVAAGVAILRHRLYDIDVVINRSLVYGALTAIIAGLYVLVVGASGELLHQTGNLVFPLLVTGLIAVLFQPLRERLQRFANRLLYGERDDPYAVLSGLGRQLEAVMAPEAVLPTLAETIAQTLKLPYVAIALERAESEPAEIAAAFGRPAAIAARLPLTYQSERVGELLVAARAPGETFTPAERRLLGDIARQAGAAVHAARLTAALQHSRERLVTAREEERRRIRRDLHDGLGPTLASHSYRLDAVLDLMDQDPAAARRLIAELKAQTQATLADIRRLVYALRPPALDELGLVAALQGQFSESANGLHIRVEAEPAALPPLSAAVEVAAFRIAAEAVTNAARHAHAENCLVRLEAANGELRVEICDDGQGLRSGARPGVGLRSMRERAAELGGVCTVEAQSSGGTRVLARLPLAGEHVGA